MAAHVGRGPEDDLLRDREGGRAASLGTRTCSPTSPTSEATIDTGSWVTAASHSPTWRPTSFDMLVLDAFSSDAIPVHLLTREAIQMYADRLRPGRLPGVPHQQQHLRPATGAPRRRRLPRLDRRRSGARWADDPGRTLEHVGRAGALPGDLGELTERSGLVDLAGPLGHLDRRLLVRAARPSVSSPGRAGQRPGGRGARRTADSAHPGRGRR